MVEYAAIVAAVAALLIAAGLFLASRIGGTYQDGAQATSAPLKPPVAQCDANYSGACVPAHPPDLDCADLRELGIETVRVLASDPHGLDRDGDGVGCN
jgi:hypothetical protein